jgi:Major Facilitator Superfamily
VSDRLPRRWIVRGLGPRAAPGPMKHKLGAPGAIALAAASIGVLIPIMRVLVEQAGAGSTAAGVFTASHVLGGVVGAAFGARALRRAGSARTLALVALLGSVAVTLAMAAIPSLSIRIGLRFLDGGCHLLAITALVAAATSGDAAVRARRAVTMGVAIVLGIAGGLGLGSQLGRPEIALVMAAALSAASLAVVLAQVAAEPLPATLPIAKALPRDELPILRTGSDRFGSGPFAPGLLAFGERFIFGTLSIALPFLATPARVGMVLGVFMVASVIAMPLARRYALASSARRLAVRSTLGFTLALAVAGVIDVLASVPIALLWAVACGAAAGALYASALVLVARSTVIEDRARDMATVHAAGNAGHALGALIAGVLIAALPSMLAIVLPGVGIIAAATLGVWITVPDAARDCPVIAGLTRGDDEPARSVAIDA